MSSRLLRTLRAAVILLWATAVPAFAGVLIADVAGSLALTAALDPEDLHAVMNGFFAVVNDLVHAQGGQINQYRGDGFMALFGAPRALPDHAKRAGNAALEIRAATERYAESVRARFGHPLVLYQ